MVIFETLIIKMSKMPRKLFLGALMITRYESGSEAGCVESEVQRRKVAALRRVLVEIKD